MQLSLLPPELLVDASARATAGIRITLPARVGAPQRPVYAATAPANATPDDELRRLEYVIVDVETTGAGYLRGHRVTEIAAIRVNGRGELLDEFESLVNPDRPISPFVTALTSITNDMVRTAPRFWEIAPRVRALLDGAVFVAHNAQFDWSFVSEELRRASAPALDCRRLCTVRLARKVVPEIPSRSLDALQYFFNVDNDARHRAYGDARATTTIFRRLLERLEDREVQRWHELEAFLKKRARRKKKQANPQPAEGV
jgi:DNA polymerase-3 subunit epsilon